METERWRGVPERPEYEVSDLGRVRSWVAGGRGGRRKRAEPRVLPGHVVPSGHVSVRLGKEPIFVHRLVLLAFVGGPPADHEGSHKNGAPSDNRLENLCWETRTENFARKRAHGTENIGEAHWQAKLTWDACDAIRARVAAGEKQIDLAHEFGVHQSQISRIAAGRRWVR